MAPLTNDNSSRRRLMRVGGFDSSSLMSIGTYLGKFRLILVVVERSLQRTAYIHNVRIIHCRRFVFHMMGRQPQLKSSDSSRMRRCAPTTPTRNIASLLVHTNFFFRSREKKKGGWGSRRMRKYVCRYVCMYTSK